MQTIWQNLKIRYRKFEKQRQELLGLSQDIRRASKSLIHQILHNKVKNPNAEIKAIKKQVDRLLGLIKRNPDLNKIRGAAEGLEEYAELIFLEYYRQGTPAVLKNLSPDFDHEALIGGIADTSGELVRLVRAKLDIVEAEKVKKYLSELYEQFLDLEVSRNNKLRNKMGDVHRNLLRLEDIIFQLKIKG